MQSDSFYDWIFMKITVLMENSVLKPMDVCGEHGLAILVERNGKKYLFDTGQSSRILNNMEVLGVNPESLDAIIISHGHYDHTGGLRGILEKTGKMPVYAHGEIFTPRYGREPFNKFIGVPFKR